MRTGIIFLQDELPIVLITALDLETFIKGHHVYEDISAPKQSEQLDVLMEPDNRMDELAVCVKINEKIAGHLKKVWFAKTIFYFLRSDSYSSAWSKATGIGVILLMERECKSFANWVYLGSQNLYLSYVKNSWKQEKFKFWHLSALFISFFSSRKFELSAGISLKEGVGAKNGLKKRMLELASDIYKEVLGNVQGTTGNSSR